MEENLDGAPQYFAEDFNQGEIDYRRAAYRLPKETWHEIFGFLDRAFLGKRVSLTNSRFYSISYYWIHVQPKRELAEMFLQSILANDEIQLLPVIKKVTRNEYKEPVPIGDSMCLPQCEIPENFIGFGLIIVNYFDEAVFGFLQHIQRLFVRVNLRIMSYEDQSVLERIAPMLQMRSLTVSGPYLIDICKKCPQVMQAPIGLLHVHLMCFETRAETYPLIREWLNTPQFGSEEDATRLEMKRLIVDDLPYYYDIPFREELIEDFLSSAQPCTYMVRFQDEEADRDLLVGDGYEPEEFESYENAETGERLSLRIAVIEEGYGTTSCFLAKRCPIEEENEQKWKPIEREMLDWKPWEEKQRLILNLKK